MKGLEIIMKEEIDYIIVEPTDSNMYGLLKDEILQWVGFPYSNWLRFRYFYR